MIFIRTKKERERLIHKMRSTYIQTSKASIIKAKTYCSMLKIKRD